jgi:pre-mRNA-processing factor SLU7
MTHKQKDCMERPRKIGAKFSNKNFGQDEIIQPKLKLTYDESRDQFNGYDPENYKQVIEEYQELEEIKNLQKEQKKGEVKRLKAEKKANGLAVDSSDSDSSQDSDIVDDDKVNLDKYQSTDPKTKSTIRNLRIREHTAKYLYNLQSDSATYNGKSRTMHDNPNPDGK